MLKLTKAMFFLGFLRLNLSARSNLNLCDSFALIFSVFKKISLFYNVNSINNHNHKNNQSQMQNQNENENENENEINDQV